MRNDLEFLIEAGSVERNHTHPGLLSDSVARHSWGVAMLCNFLCWHAGCTISPNLLLACLTHDLGEVAASDVNGAAKNQLYSKQANAEREHIEAITRACFGCDYSNLAPLDEAFLIMADKLEYMLRCIRERRHGNITVTRGYRETQNIVYAYLAFSQFDRDVPHVHNAFTTTLGTINDMWKDANVGIAPDFDVYKEVANAEKRSK